MTPKDRRRLWRTLQERAGGLLVYLLALTTALALFLASLHSCAEGPEQALEDGVRIEQEPR